MYRRSVAALVSLIVLAAVPLCTHATEYRVTPIGLGIESIPYALNESGEMAGIMGYPSDEYVLGRAARFTPAGSMQELPMGSGSVFAAGTAINAAGQIVGHIKTPPPNSIDHACTWVSGNLGPLDMLAGYPKSRATCINNHGLIAGLGMSADNLQSQACLWDSTGVHGLGTLPGDQCSEPSGINNRGELIGRSLIGTWNYSYDPVHAFFRDSAGLMQDMGTIRNHTKAFTTAINNYGQVVGYCTDNYSTDFIGWTYAFIWDRKSGFREIPMLPGATGNRAFGINDRGQVVGACEYYPSGTRAFVWDEASGLQDLGDMFADPNSWGVDINNNGQILIRHGQYPYDSTRSASLLSPIPVPSPAINITWPSSEPVVETPLAELNASGNAADFFGLNRVEWATNRGSQGTCVGTEYWTAVGVPILEGSNYLIVSSHSKANVYRQDTVTINRVPTSVGKAKSYLQKKVCVRDAVVTATGIEVGSVFVQSSDRSSGIRLITDRQLLLGDRVSFIGTIAYVNGDYQARDVVFTDVTGGKPLRPLLMNSLSLASSPLPGIGRDGVDATNMLVSMIGRVKQVVTEERVVYIDDVGNYARHSGGCAEGIRVHIPSAMSLPEMNDLVIATGISRFDTVTIGELPSGNPYVEYQTAIWPRDTTDITVQSPVTSGQ